MKNFKIKLLYCLTSILLFSNCDITGPIILPVNPEEQVNVIRTIDIDSFTGVRLYTSATVEITEGDMFSIEVTGPENIVSQIETETIVDNEVLNLQYEEFFSNTQVDIRISMPSVQYLENIGTGNIVGQNTFKDHNLSILLIGTGDIDVIAEVAEIEAEIIGTGNILLAGYTPKLSNILKGTGNLLAFNLEAERAVLTNYGQGDMEVLVTTSLACGIFGTGSILYQGNPNIEADLKGTGVLINAN